MPSVFDLLCQLTSQLSGPSALACAEMPDGSSVQVFYVHDEDGGQLIGPDGVVVADAVSWTPGGCGVSSESSGQYSALPPVCVEGADGEPIRVTPVLQPDGNVLYYSPLGVEVPAPSIVLDDAACCC